MEFQGNILLRLLGVYFPFLYICVKRFVWFLKKVFAFFILRMYDRYRY